MPDSSDVDVHIVQRGRGAWAPAEEVGGLLLQCTVQNIALSSVEAVLRHPFEAEPLLFGAILADPRSALAATRARAAADFGHPQWVRARCEGAIASAHEWFDRVRPDDASGSDAAVPLFAWGVSSLAACLAVSRRREPAGRKCLLMAREVLQEAGRPDLQDALLGLLGVDGFTGEQARRYHAESMRLFDAALQVHHTFVPCDNLLRPFCRANLRAGGEELLEAGFHREAMWRVQRTYFPVCQVLIADAPEDERPRYRRMWDAFRNDIGLATAAQVRDRLAAARSLAGEIRTVALEAAAG